MDTRLTNPLTPVQFIIKNNILGSHTGGYHVRIYKGFYPYTTSNILCSNTTATGSATLNYVEAGIVYTGCAATNQSPVVNAGADQTITLPASSVTLSGSATDADGSVSSYLWTKTGGPSAGTISTPSSASTQVSGLTQGTYTFRLTATDNASATGYDEVTVTVNAQSTTPPASSSIKIEAESFTSMAGIGTENTSDVGGGLNVGWQDNNDWMNYSVNLATAGTYTVNFRVASYFSGAQFQVKKADGTVLTTVTVPNTGSFQTWQTVSAQVTLPAGQQTLRIFTSAANGGWNFNWWEIMGESSTTNPPTTPTPPTEPTTPTTGSTKIEAESYSSMAGIGTENTLDIGGGLDVGWQDDNDWMDYAVNLSAAGTYTVNFRVASFFAGAQFQLRKSDGTVLTTVTVPNTGSFQTWQTVSAQVTLPAGQQTLRIFTSAAHGGWNINWWEIMGGSSTTPPPTTPTSTKIEAESYSAMAGIGTENTSDAGGGLNVGWQDTNDWMDYVVNASAAGTYTANFRVASYFTGAQFQVRKADGTVLATVTVPNTGSFQSWQTVSAQIALSAGQQTLRIFTSAANGGWNFNWWEITSSAAARGTETAGTVEQVLTSTASAAALQVFPNPISDRFMLKVNNQLTGKMKVEIYDMKGAVVKQFSVSKPSAGVSQSYLSIGDLQTGQYILKVSMNNYSEKKQLIRQ
jgi:5-hydroxyisourate hydrolase-like protein (transthyretin family)